MPHPTEPNTFFVGTRRGIFTSTNAKDWSRLGTLSSDVRELAVDPVHPATLYATVMRNRASYQVWRFEQLDDEARQGSVDATGERRLVSRQF